MATLQSGHTLGSRFTLIRSLGSGGMGEAWLARDEHLETDLVVKIVPPESPAEAVALLRQECLKARRLAHPGIVRVFDFHQYPGQIFLTMEFVDGESIAALRGAPAAEIIATVLPLVEALEYSHGEGVVHRDLKCSNVLLDAQGRPRLTDFGIAGVLDPEPGGLRIAGGGSPGHASPQQLAGQGPDPADDIYGLGALLFELLCGFPPRSGDRARLATLALGPVPKRLERLVASMLSPEVEKRPGDMAAVRRALETIVAEPTEQATVPPRVEKTDIRLSPPPKVPLVRVAEPASEVVTRSDSTARASARPWLTVVLSLVLTGAIFAVFVLLPRWVEDRPSSVGGVRDAAAGRRSPSMAPGIDAAADSASTDSDAAPERSQRGSIASSEPPLPAAVPATAPPPPRIDPAPTAQRVVPTAPPAAARGDENQSKPFTEAMSAGLSAFERGDFERAKSAFERALTLSPESTEAADGLARSEQELRLATIAAHRERGAQFEQAERWVDAVAEYRSVMAIDRTLRFAKEGLSRAESRADLDRRLRAYLDDPERLSADRVLFEAREALAEGRSIQPVTPLLGQQLAALEKQIETASTPVPVLLLSDNETQVVVYRVGRLGAFERKSLELRPGTYTVVGSRDGYRDVRHHLRVVAGGGEATLTVRCEEKI